MPKTINIQTDRKEIAIQRDGEYVGSIYFSPSDVSILNRLREAQQKLEDFKVNTEVADLDEMLDEANRADKALRDAIDYAFDYPCSDVVFGKVYIMAVWYDRQRVVCGGQGALRPGKRNRGGGSCGAESKTSDVRP